MRPFMQIPFDLSDAVADLGLGRYQQIVLNAILKEVLGPAKASLVSINQAELSRRHGVHRQHLSRGLQELLKLRIIVQHGNNYGFNYVTSEWTRNGESLPSFASMTVTTDDAASMDVTKSGYKQPEVVTESGYTHVTENGYKSTDSQPPCNQIRLQMSPDSVTNVTNSGYTSSIEKEIQHQEGESEEISKPEEAPSSRVEPKTNPFQEIEDWLEKVTTNPCVKEGLHILSAGYSTDWTLKALREAAVKHPKDANKWLSYANGCLKKWAVKGGPEVDTRSERQQADRAVPGQRKPSREELQMMANRHRIVNGVKVWTYPELRQYA